MDITLADERLFVLEERLTYDEIRQRAADKRTHAFSAGLGGLLQRPKTEDVVLVASQRRLEPFWHVAGHARYVYQRTRTYTVPTSAPEVYEVTIGNTNYPIQRAVPNNTFPLSVVENCVEDIVREVFVDGRTGQPVADGSSVIGGPRSEVTDVADLAQNETIVLPPEQRASFVVRSLLGEVMKPVQADRIIEESLGLDAVDLFYRPVWAFEYRWTPRDKTGVVEIDGVSGLIRQANALLPQLKGMMSNKDAWFDIGADTVGMIVPGGNIAVKVARVAFDRSRQGGTPNRD